MRILTRSCFRTAMCLHLLAACVLTLVPLKAVAESANCVTTPEGLIAWWRGESNALDVLSFSNGVLTNGASVAPGMVGQAFAFYGTNWDGTAASVVVTNNPPLSGLSAITIEAWVYPQASASPWQAVLNRGYWRDSLDPFGLYVTQTSQGKVYCVGGVYTTNWTTMATGTKSLPLNAWTHLAMTHDGAALTLYVNGEVDAKVQANGTLVWNPGTLRIGHGFVGRVDEPSLYSRALEQSEIRSIYQAGAAGKCTPAFPPAIQQQPTDLRVDAGTSAEFKVLAIGTEPLSYQWMFNGTPLPGATKSVLWLNDIQHSQAGVYAVQVTNALGSILSSNAVLRVTSCLPPPLDLVSLWPAEGTGADALGKNPGNLVNGVTFAQGVSGQAFEFDGQYRSVEITNNSSLGAHPQVTVAAWVYPNNGFGSSLTVLSKDDGWNARDLYLTLDRRADGFAIGHAGLSTARGWGSAYGTNLIPCNAWTHVAMTYDGKALTLYINGQPDTSVPVSGTTAANARSLHIGYGPDGSFSGRIDEVGFYQRSLTAAEVKAIANNPDGGICPQSAAPFIFVQPTNQLVYESQTATLHVVAGGTPPLSYQWTLEGTNLPGATQLDLTLSDIQLSQAGHYAVRVTNAYGDMMSTEAVLDITPLPPCGPAPNDLISWWRAENDGSDSIRDNDGFLTNGVSFAQGVVGQAFVLEGDNSYVQVRSTRSLSPTNAFTLEAWIYPEANPDYYGALLAGKENSNGQRQYSLWLDRSAQGKPILHGRAVLGGYSQGLDGTNEIPLNAWTHVALTYDGSELRLYENGALDVSKPAKGSIATSTEPFRIGGNLSGGTPFVGRIDEVALYSRGLTQPEIQAIIGYGPAGKCVGDSAPFLFLQPAAQTVTEGTFAAFTAFAGGTTPLGYQWSLNGTNIDAATNASLAFLHVSAADAGIYAVQVTNALGSIVSTGAVLTVTPAPPCVAAPPGQVSWWAGEGDFIDDAGKNHGLSSSQVSFAPGIVGQSFVFGQGGDAVRIGDSPGLRLQDFTIEAWVRRSSRSLATSGNGSWGYIFGYGSGGFGFAIGNNGSLQLAQVGYSSSYPMSSVSPSGVSITDTNFHHLAVSKQDSLVVFYVDGKAYPAPDFDPGFSFTTSAAIGNAGDLYSAFLGQIDELAIYDRGLNDEQVRSVYLAGPTGRCVPPVPPFLTTQPTSQTVAAGSTATFSAAMGGARPLSCQWFFNDAPIAGATAFSLLLTNVLPAQQGKYSVLVTNAFGSVRSSHALLTVTLPPARVTLLTAAANQETRLVSVPVLLTANGDENALSFSLSFYPSLLTFAGIEPGADAEEAAFLINTSRLSNGLVGISLALPSYATFAPGTQEIALLNFSVAALTNATTTTLSLGDNPFPRELLDLLGEDLPVSFVGAPVIIPAARFEGDVSPAPDGNRVVNIMDWVLAGQYAARLGYATNSAEFQQADCAPRATAGDGAITLADWVQVGRYAGGLDRWGVAAGPASELPVTKAGPSALRQVTLSAASLTPGQPATLALSLAAQGTENALGCSIAFDPNLASFQEATPGSDAAGVTLYLNSSQVDAGRLGLVAALSPGSVFPPGTREVIRLTFRASPSASGQLAPQFADLPVRSEVADAQATALPVTFGASGSTNEHPAALRITQGNGNVILAWPSWAADCVLQESLETSTGWTNSAATPALNGDEFIVTVPVTQTTRFYRLSR